MRHKRFGLSDGASISYDSASWSQILTRAYTKNPQVNRLWLEQVRNEFSRLHNRDTLPWTKQAAFDRGSFASLLGVQYLNEIDRIQVLAVGDSIAVLCDGTSMVKSWPYSNWEEFSASPLLLSTNPDYSYAFNGSEIPQEWRTEWSIRELRDPIVFCMTDALGEWFLKHRPDDPAPISILLSLNRRKAFHDFVLEQRARGNLKRDDTTLLILTLK